MEKIRTLRFAPYLKGMGPTFTLTMYATGRIDTSYRRNQEYVAYRLTMREHGQTVTLFEGDDYSPSPGYGIASDQSARGLMGFLCLTPDSGCDCFETYTQTQLDFVRKHAETLECEVSARLGDD